MYDTLEVSLFNLTLAGLHLYEAILLLFLLFTSKLPSELESRIQLALRSLKYEARSFQ